MSCAMLWRSGGLNVKTVSRVWDLFFAAPQMVRMRSMRTKNSDAHPALINLNEVATEGVENSASSTPGHGSPERTWIRRADEWADRKRLRGSGGRYIWRTHGVGGDAAAPRDGGDYQQAAAAHDVRRFGKQGLWQDALAVFAAVPEPDAKMHVAAMSACAKSMQVGRVFKLFEAMPTKTVSAFDVLIAATGTRDPQRAEALIDEMRSAGVHPDAGIYRTVIEGYGRTHYVEDALRVFSDMQANGIQASIVTYQSVMAACARTGDRVRARQLLERLQADGLQPDAGHFTSAIVSCSIHKGEEEALKIFESMQARRLRIDAVTYTALVGCLSGPGPRVLQKADELRLEMKENRVLADIFFFNALLTAARDARDSVRFRRYVAEIDRIGLEYTRTTHARIREMEEVMRAYELERRPALEEHAPLPAGWAEALDPSSGQPYYWQQADPANTVTWDRPLP